MTRSDLPGPLELLAHSRFLERLAAHLTDDPEDAADTVQETWLKAFANPARHGGNLRSWLRTIANNNVYRSLGRRRSVTELGTEIQDAVQPDPGESAAEQREILVRVRGEVDRLREPYRSVVLLRYFSEKSPAEIAEQLGRPVHTVNSQLHRSLQLLRERLDAVHDGDRSAWSLVLVAWLAERRHGRAQGDTATVGGWGLALALGVAVTGVAILWLAVHERGGVPAQTVTAADRPERESIRGDTPPELRATREPVASPEPPTDSERGAPPEPVGSVEVLVVDGNERPIANAAVLALTTQHDPIEGREPRSPDAQYVPGERLLTGADGRVTFPVHDANRISPAQLQPGREYVGFSVTRDGYVAPDLHCLPFPEAERRQLRVVLTGPAVAARVLVRNDAGEPVVGDVSIWSAPTSSHLSDAGPDGVRLLAYPPREMTDLDGVFTHTRLAQGRHRLRVDAPGFVRYQDWIELGPGSSPTERVVVLDRGYSVTGGLSAADGAPVAGAVVWAEIGVANLSTRPRTTVDEHGAFRLEGIPEGDAWLFARHESRPSWIAAMPMRFSQADPEPVWFPLLEPRPGVRILLRTEDGRPALGRTLHLRTPPGSEAPPWFRVVDADERGEVRVFDCPDTTLTAEAFLSKDDLYRGSMPDASLRDVLPRHEEYVITIPTTAPRGTVSGRLVDDRGATLAGAKLFLRGRGRSLFQEIAGTDDLGEFSSAELSEGGDLIACIPGMGTALLGELDLRDGGDVRVERALGPTTQVDVYWTWTGSPGDFTHELVSKRPVGKVTLSWSVLRGEELPPSRLQLLPGSYHLLVRERGVVVDERPFVVSSGSRCSVSTGPGL